MMLAAERLPLKGPLRLTSKQLGQRFDFVNAPSELFRPNPPRSPSSILKAMSSNVGLTTPRGSGTSGYVQRNLSNLKPRDNFAPYPKDHDLRQHRQRQPDKDILNHDRLREIEVKVFDLRDKLEDEGYATSLFLSEAS